MIRLLPITVLLVALSGCSIKQHIEPAQLSENTSICIVEDKAVREGFLIELTKILSEKLVAYEVVGLQEANNCDWKLTYTARWSWDLTIYMSYAEIKIYRNGALDGEAIYDARMGGGRLDKFIDAEPKIRELVEALIQREQALNYFDGRWKFISHNIR